MISAQTRTPISFNAIHSRKCKLKLSICKRTSKRSGNIQSVSAFSCYSSICKYARLEYTFFQVASVNPAPKVSEEEGSYPSRFYCWFLESSKSCLLLRVAAPGLIDTLAQLLAWRALLWLSMMWRWRYLAQSNFLSTTSLAWSLALHLVLFQSGEASTVEGNKHAHTQHARVHIPVYSRWKLLRLIEKARIMIVAHAFYTCLFFFYRHTSLLPQKENLLWSLFSIAN